MEKNKRDLRKLIFIILDENGDIVHRNISEKSCHRLIKDHNLVPFDSKTQETTEITKDYILTYNSFEIRDRYYSHFVLRLKNDPENLYDVAYIDFFTNLYNRNLWEQLVNGRMKLPSAETYALLMMDIDNLKNLNDNYGHLSGDRAIKVIADSILKVLKAEQVCIRYGGDEFLILIPNGTAKDCRLLFEDIERNIQLIRTSKKIKYPISISVGISKSTWKDEKKITSALKKADVRMYKHKLEKQNEPERNPIDVN